MSHDTEDASNDKVWHVTDFPDSELVTIDGQVHPLVDGKVRIFNTHYPDHDLETEPVPELTTDQRVCFRARIVDANVEPASGWIYGTSHADGDENVQHSLVMVAETRAIGRRLRFWGIGVGAAGAEEIGSVPRASDEDKLVLVADPDNGEASDVLEAEGFSKSPSLGAWFVEVDPVDAGTVAERVESEGVKVRVHDAGTNGA